MQAAARLGSQVQPSNLSAGLRVCANFARTVDVIAEQLNKSIPVNKLKRFLSVLCHPLMPENNFITRSVYEQKCTTEDVIFSLIPQYINYLSFSLLEEIIDTFDNREAKTALNAYKRETRKFRLRELSPPVSDDEIDDFQGQKRLKITVDVDEDKATVDDVHSVTGAVEQATGISRSSQIFTAWNDSTSILLVFFIPETVTDIFHHLCTEDLTILANAGITKIQLEDLEIANISRHMTNTKEVSEKRVQSVKPTSLEHYLDERTDLSSDQHLELNVMLKKVTESKLSEVCNEQLLQKFSQHMQNWKTLAPFLGMQDFYSDEFTARYPERMQQNYQLLLFWKRKEGSRAIYHHLLETVVLHGTAREMKALIQIPLAGMHTRVLVRHSLTLHL